MQQRTQKSLSYVTTGAAIFGAALVLGAPRATGNAALDAQDKKVAAQVESVIRERVVSPDNKLQLVIKPTSRSESGYFSEILVAGRLVKIKKLPVTEFYLHARDVRINMPRLAKRKIYTLQSQTKMRAVITEEDLTSMFAQGKHTAAMGLKVKFLKDPKHGEVLRVSGNWKWTWFNGPVTGVGKLRLAKDNQLYADIISLKLNGREVPPFVKNKFGEKLNPVLDYDDVPFQPKFRSVKIEGSRATISS